MSKDNSLVVIGCLSAIILVPLLAVLGVVINGYVVMYLWGWFVVPLGLPYIGYLHAAGIAMLFEYMGPQVDTTNLARKEGAPEGIPAAIATLVGRLLFRPAIALLAGYILHAYMH